MTQSTTHEEFRTVYLTIKSRVRRRFSWLQPADRDDAAQEIAGMAWKVVRSAEKKGKYRPELLGSIIFWSEKNYACGRRLCRRARVGRGPLDTGRARAMGIHGYSVIFAG